MALRELLEEQDLVHWNINSNKYVTSVVIRFAMPGQCSHTPVTWRKSPSQYRRDRQRFTNYARAQNNRHRGAHFDSHQYNENMILLMKIYVPVSVDTNLDVNKNSSGHMLNNNTTHISKESNDHDNEEDSDEEGDTSKDGDGDDTVSYSKFKFTGTNDDFDKIVMDFRQCEKQAFLRGLVKDRRITEILIGASDDLLTVMERNNANQSEYGDLHAFIN